MTTDWPTTRARIIEAFNGERPGATLEQQLTDIFEANPNAVINSIDSVATSLSEGRVNSGWAVLRKAAADRALTPAGQTLSKEKLVRNADQWLRSTGAHFDVWHEVEDELFGDRGRLKSIDSPVLRTRYREAWESVRPVGAELERDEVERAKLWVEQHAALNASRNLDPVPA